MTSRTAVRPLLIICLVFSLACTSAGPRPGAPAVRSPLPGFSGLAHLGGGSYLVVHDVKASRDGARLGLLTVRPDEGLRLRPLAVGAWKHPDGRAGDLESACPVPGRRGEALVSESGYREGLGRIFHLRVEGDRARVLAVYMLPRLDQGSPGGPADNFEGLACAALPDGRLLLLLGERGRSDAHPRGLLRWGILEPDGDEVRWTADGRATIPVRAPGAWGEGVASRDISALHVDPEGRIWAAAAADGRKEPESGKGDTGPFGSVIYCLGRLTGDPADPVEPEPEPRAVWTVDGLKVEALGAPAATLQPGALSFASEDEELGGVWRMLLPPPD